MGTDYIILSFHAFSSTSVYGFTCICSKQFSKFPCLASYDKFFSFSDNFAYEQCFRVQHASQRSYLSFISGISSFPAIRAIKHICKYRHSACLANIFSATTLESARPIDVANKQTFQPFRSHLKEQNS